MESMDEMFVPYKSTLEIPAAIPQPALTPAPQGSALWIGIAIVFVFLIIAAYFFMGNARTAQEKSAELAYDSEIVKNSPQPPPQNQKLIGSATSLPATIDFSQPAKLNTETMSKEELAKFVGTEIKNLLVLYSGVSSLQTASIVSHSVRTMLEDFAPVLQPQAVQPQAKEPSMEKLDEEFISKKVLQPRPQHSHVNLEADTEEEEKDPPKKGKINADTDPSLLLMLKQRGLVQ